MLSFLISFSFKMVLYQRWYSTSVAGAAPTRGARDDAGLSEIMRHKARRGPRKVGRGGTLPKVADSACFPCLSTLKVPCSRRPVSPRLFRLPRSRGPAPRPRTRLLASMLARVTLPRPRPHRLSERAFPGLTMPSTLYRPHIDLTSTRIATG